MFYEFGTNKFHERDVMLIIDVSKLTINFVVRLLHKMLSHKINLTTLMLICHIKKYDLFYNGL